LKRLSLDWETVYGHPIIVVETFVDMERFRGTCYRASGWHALGLTRGYSRNAGKYYYHGNQKMIFMRPLRRDAIRLLLEPLSQLNDYNKEGHVHLVSAFLQREGIAIAQKEVDAAGAEIDGARQMLKDMDIQQPTLRAKFKEAKWYMAQRYYARRPHLTLGLIGL
jgi:hypothetical protein